MTAVAATAAVKTTAATVSAATTVSAAATTTVCVAAAGTIVAAIAITATIPVAATISVTAAVSVATSIIAAIVADIRIWIAISVGSITIRIHVWVTGVAAVRIISISRSYRYPKTETLSMCLLRGGEKKQRR
jgi:hypothetical protein